MLPCTQKEQINTIVEQVADLQKNLDQHRKAQQEQDESSNLIRQEHDMAVNHKLDYLSSQMKDLIELNTDVSNIKVAWKVGKMAGASIVKFILAMTVIFGAIYAIKEWIKK
ncbi:MAG: hypothetical protein AB9866_18980 [Syntrophobacteraceae bacterium]